MNDDSIPVGIYDDFETEEEREEFLTGSFDDITYTYFEAKNHDTDGFFADEVGSAGCLAAGHTVYEDQDDDPLYDDGTHIRGWDWEPLCTATRYGEACTYCEGECQVTVPTVDLWAMVRAT